ncbi:hypothetical protein [Amycolatopsis sp. NPDC051372]|uniref:hypothetical protein n=1 Tax=Amycolatopsis sp. NPDC051372 TaxID=3155669 RepID=UPI00343A93FC
MEIGRRAGQLREKPLGQRLDIVAQCGQPPGGEGAAEQAAHPPVLGRVAGRQRLKPWVGDEPLDLRVPPQDPRLLHAARSRLR